MAKKKTTKPKVEDEQDQPVAVDVLFESSVMAMMRLVEQHALQDYSAGRENPLSESDESKVKLLARQILTARIIQRVIGIAELDEGDDE